MIQARHRFARDDARSTISLAQQQEQVRGHRGRVKPFCLLVETFFATANGSVFLSIAVCGFFFLHLAGARGESMFGYSK